MLQRRRIDSATVVVLVLLATVYSTRVQTWGPQGHRLVALIAAERLTPVARQNVVWLLGPQSLADVSSWADQYREGNYQTFFWHFLDIPPEATSYDRDRDCPLQPGVTAGSRADKWARRERRPRLDIRRGVLRVESLQSAYGLGQRADRASQSRGRGVSFDTQR
ncbi:MAG: hypothetical protein HY047_02880 [Acidobacteria bacterium]|nr:hypothetical protein [Acidobacteriota bacterium]